MSAGKRRFELPTDEELEQLTELGRHPVPLSLPSASTATPSSASTALPVVTLPPVAVPPVVSAVAAVVPAGLPEAKKPRTLVSTSASMTAQYDRAIKVNPNQNGNPVLKHVRNVPVQFEAGLVPDFVVGDSTCIIFLSLKYHLRFPKYLEQRLAALFNTFQLRIVLTLIDEESHLLHGALNQLSVMALERKFSLIPAWSNAEAARYIESYKFYERTGADLIRGRVAPDFPSQLATALTQIKAVNKSDVKTLNNQIGSLVDICNASLEELLVCRGLGATKAKRLHAAMRRPLTAAAEAPKKPAAAAAAAADADTAPLDLEKLKFTRSAP